ncbi:nucleotide 5'-monophosphate nucleosidase PpnN [Teredinibacter turnerae]|uniref:nucleotide 5'-monophosphate nucleosidase PpnN n=1 Tax=Teredinibacter turnerae TaxID=2426 RepID=UPI0005F82428|nr:nucleotide 5'-monophosphate nucleosidase PpnN [Teredinibacter turnerae]
MLDSVSIGAAGKKISALITPDNTLNVLSQLEVARLVEKSNAAVYETFRRCALAALNTGAETDNTKQVLEQFRDFEIDVVQQERGIKLHLKNAPGNAFVDGEMVQGIKEHLFSALRDIIYVNNELLENSAADFHSSEGITNGVFQILRNSSVLKVHRSPSIIVCWGGHSINEVEYDYSKEVGYQMGLRGLDICTGCGPGAMKGPMKGATFGHAKQRIQGRYIGITEPGIIAAESPNPIVSELVILPDIEKRLEAFVRLGHGIVVFPGGVGTAEEILYLLGILLHPDNRGLPFPLIFSGPASAAEYFGQIDEFIGLTLGKEAQGLYEIILDDPVLVAQKMRAGMDVVRNYRKQTHDAYYYNWVLKIDQDLQSPFKPTHQSMSQLSLRPGLAPNLLAANLRKAFSGIVDGNVKEHGIHAVAEKGPYQICGDPHIMKPLDALLRSFVAQKRMKIPTEEYIPCYQVVV